MFTFPNHKGFSLYIITIILISLVLTKLRYIILISAVLALLRYYTYVQYSESNHFLILLIGTTVYIFLGILVSKLVKSLIEGRNSQIRIIFSFIQIIQMRDHYTAVHSRHVAEHARLISKEMGLKQEFEIDIFTGGLLHDIGKIGISDYILLKPGPLNYAEYNEIKKHPQLGIDLLQNVPLIKNKVIHDCILYHHERYDGKGYLKGLEGNDIPLAGRILAVADAYDAVTTHRVYQQQRSPNEALKMLQQNAGTQFDPDIV